MDVRELDERIGRLAAPPTFILGQGRSGTTWTLEVYGAHPEVCAIFETWLLSNDSGIANVFHQPQWDPAFQEPRAEQVGYRAGMAQLMDLDEFTADVRAMVMRWFARAIGPGHRFLVEKGPADIAVLTRLFPDARLVHVIRDGRDVAQSMQAGARTWAPEFYEAGTNLAEWGARWRSEVESIRAALAAAPNPHIELRFEELRADPHAAYRRLFDFSEIPYDDAILDAVHAATDFDAARGGRGTDFRRGGRSGWESVFTPEDRRAFAAVAGPLLVELGYEPDDAWAGPARRRRALRRR